MLSAFIFYKGLKEPAFKNKKKNIGSREAVNVD